MAEREEVWFACNRRMEAVSAAYRDGRPRLNTHPFNNTVPDQVTYLLVPKNVDHFACRAGQIGLKNPVRRQIANQPVVIDGGRYLIAMKGEMFGFRNLFEGLGKLTAIFE